MLFEKRNTINTSAIIRLLGILLFIEAAFMCPPLAVSFFYNEPDATWSFAYSIAITAGCGILAVVFPSRNNDMGKREGFLLTGLTWIVFSLFGMLPFVLLPNGLDITNAFFESMSGFTTTGATIYRSVESLPHGILLWRSITHLIGGLGIILFTLAVIPMLNKQSGLQLFNAEVTGITHEKLRPRISHTAKSLWVVYLTLNLILAVLLWLGPMDLFDAICHAFSTIATGGFSTRDASINAYGSDYVKIVLSVFMFISGISFSLIYKLSRGHFREFMKNSTIRWYLGIVSASIIIIGTVEYFNNDVSFTRLLVDIPCQITSAITTTGFNATDINFWQHASIVVLIALMTIGACAGSTTGGIKIDRLVLLGKNMKNELYKILYPNTITQIRINGKILHPEQTSKAGAFLLIFVLSIFAGTLSLALSGMDIFDSIFATVSCLGNNGLCYELKGSSYADIGEIGKWVMSALMLIGRLEFFTIVILFTKAFWYK